MKLPILIAFKACQDFESLPWQTGSEDRLPNARPSGAEARRWSPNFYFHCLPV